MQSNLHEARKRPNASALEPNLTLKLPEERGDDKTRLHFPSPHTPLWRGPGSTAWAPVGNRKERSVVRFGFCFQHSSVLTGWGVAFGSVDFTCRCVIMACRRSLSFASWKGREKKYPLLVVQIKPSLCLFLIKQLAPRHETEEFYCWVVWKLYMGYSWGKANAWCWVSPFPKAKCISPWVRRARPAGTKSFTPALTAKRQQWIMFINQPHSSSGGAAEGKQGSSSRMSFPPFRAQNKRQRWAVALHQPQALWHMQRAQTAVVRPHEAPPQGSAGSLGSKSILIWLEKVAEPLEGHPGKEAGHQSRGTCTGQDLLWELPVSLWHKPEGSEVGKAESSSNHPKTLIPGHPMPLDWCCHPFSSATSGQRVGVKLLLSMSLAFYGKDPHQATAGVFAGMHP